MSYFTKPLIQRLNTTNPKSACTEGDLRTVRLELQIKIGESKPHGNSWKKGNVCGNPNCANPEHYFFYHYKNDLPEWRQLINSNQIDKNNVPKPAKTRLPDIYKKTFKKPSKKELENTNNVLLHQLEKIIRQQAEEIESLRNQLDAQQQIINRSGSKLDFIKAQLEDV